MTKNFWEWDPTFDLVPDESALLVIDMQNAFVQSGSALEVPMAKEQIPTFQKLISYCRQSSIPVIYTRFCVTDEQTYRFWWRIARQRGIQASRPVREMWPDKPESQIISELQPNANELVIEKYGYDCFADTSLEEHLGALGVSNLLITGTVLNWCVDSTVRTAYHKKYDVTVISDAVSSYDQAGATAEDWWRMELNLFAEAFGRVLPSEDVIDELTMNKKQSVGR